MKALIDLIAIVGVIVTYIFSLAASVVGSIFLAGVFVVSLPFMIIKAVLQIRKEDAEIEASHKHFLEKNRQ